MSNVYIMGTLINALWLQKKFYVNCKQYWLTYCKVIENVLDFRI